MRKIEYRGFHPCDKEEASDYFPDFEFTKITIDGKEIEGVWLVGNLICDEDYRNIVGVPIDSSDDSYSLDWWGGVIPETVGQFTNMTDANDNQIFEGDILAFIDELETCDNYNKVQRIGKVTFENGSFVIEDNNGVKHYRWIDYNCKKVGNIYDNPELINDYIE